MKPRRGPGCLAPIGALRTVSAALIFSILLAAHLIFAPRAEAGDCAVSRIQPTTPRRVPTLREAKRLAYAKHYSDARALYLWVLARQPADSEARAGLARVDAWDGCWQLAEGEFREALSAHPDDSDIRGGLIDLYMWEKRWDEAQYLIDDGLALEHDNETLLLHRARLLHYMYNDTGAREILQGLQQRGVKDEELQALGDEVFVGEASVGLRFDAYPGSYPNIYTMDAQLLERWRRFEFGLNSHLVDWTGGSLTSPIVDGERSLRVAFHPAAGYTLAVEGGFGNPGVVLPRGEGAAEVAFPIYGRFTGVLDYDYWAFSGNESVHILNPTIAYEASDDLEVAAHAWIVHVGVGQTPLAAWAETWGAHVGWKATPRLHLVLYYTYGAQLDRDPTFSELFTLRSHVLTGAADWLLARNYGVRGLLAGERRAQDGVPTIYVGSVGASFYVRW